MSAPDTTPADTRAGLCYCGHAHRHHEPTTGACGRCACAVFDAADPPTLRDAARWVKDNTGQEPSPLGAAVAEILAVVFRGIYHVDDAVRRVDWTRRRCIIVPLERELATHDGSELTALVALAHEAGLRLAIRPRNFRLLTVQFTAGEGVMWFGTIPRAHAAIRRALGHARDTGALGALLAARDTEPGDDPTPPDEEARP